MHSKSSQPCDAMQPAKPTLGVQPPQGEASQLEKRAYALRNKVGKYPSLQSFQQPIHKHAALRHSRKKSTILVKHATSQISSPSREPSICTGRFPFATSSNFPSPSREPSICTGRFLVATSSFDHARRRRVSVTVHSLHPRACPSQHETRPAGDHLCLPQFVSSVLTRCAPLAEWYHQVAVRLHASVGST